MATARTATKPAAQSPLEWARRRVIAITLTASVPIGAATAIYLVATGARSIAPTVFMAAGAATLTLVVGLLARAAIALALEPAPEEVALATGRRKKELEREKQGLLKALKELEFDHEMGKVSDRDYGEIAQRYRARAIDVMRRLDEKGPDYRALVERELAARVAAAGAAPRREPLAPTTTGDAATVAPGADAANGSTSAATTSTGEGGAATGATSTGEGGAATGAATTGAAASSSRAATSASASAPSAGASASTSRTSGNAAATRGCPACATRNDDDAVFCKKCGHRFTAAEAT